MQLRKETQQKTTEKMLTAGHVLKAYREKKGYTIKEIAAATKIPLHQLEAIERDDYGTYENQVFVRGFVRNYAEYLRLDTEKVLAIYRRTAATTFKTKIIRKAQQIGGKNEKPRPKNLAELIERIELTPTKIITGLSTLLILFVGIFLATQLYKFQTPPTLELSSPDNNVTTETDQIEIKGVTELNAIIKVNDGLIPTSQQVDKSSFTTNVKLVPGVNTIVIKAYKNNNEERANIITRNITYKKVETVVPAEEQKPIEPTKFKVKVQVDTEAAWIMLNLDGKQIYASILPVGTTEEYEFTKTLESTTGKATTSRLVINEEVTPYVIDYTSGTASLNCQIKDNKLSCNK